MIPLARGITIVGLICGVAAGSLEWAHGGKVPVWLVAAMVISLFSLSVRRRS